MEKNMNEKVTKLMNEFVNLDNKLQLALGNNDYETAAKIRDERNRLAKDVFTNIVKPYIPLSFEFDLNKIKR